MQSRCVSTWQPINSLLDSSSIGQRTHHGLERLDNAAILASMEIIWALEEDCYVFQSRHRILLIVDSLTIEQLPTRYALERCDDISILASIEILWHSGKSCYIVPSSHGIRVLANQANNGHNMLRKHSALYQSLLPLNSYGVSTRIDTAQSVSMAS